MEFKMRYILYALFALSLVGCGCFKTPETKYVYVEVFTPPNVEMPKRPVLVSTGGDIDTVTKNAEKDLLDLKTYAIQLEKLISDLLKSKKQ